jgi:hypothetical protein
MSYLTIRSAPPQSTSSTPQAEASCSNQSQKDQELQFQHTSNGLAPLPFIAHGAIGSGTSTRDLENSLQKAQENFIKSQIEVRKKLDSKVMCVSYKVLDRCTLTPCELQYRTTG